MSVPISWYLILAAALFAIGVYGVLARRNALVGLLAIQLMLNAVNLSAVAFARQLGDPTGRLLVVLTIAVALAEAAIGLAIFLALHRSRRTLDLDRINLMRG